MDATDDERRYAVFHLGEGRMQDRKFFHDMRVGMEQGGYAGVFALMLLENLFPPLPSELIMPLAGFHCARGTFDLAPTIVAGTLGSVVGA